MQLTDSGSGTRRVISLTPLIDVVFILLLFFMLSTQFNQQQAISLGVPAEKGHQPAQVAGLKLRVENTGNIIVENGERVLPASLSSHASVLAAIDQAESIQLDADDDASLQQLILVTDLLEQAGVRAVNLTALR